MYDYWYALTLDDHKQIIDWQLKGHEAQPDKKKKKESLIVRVISGITLLNVLLFFCNMVVDLLGYAGFFVLLSFLILLGVMISTWGQRKIRFYRIRKEFCRNGGPQEVHLIFDKQEVRVETRGFVNRYSYSSVNNVVTWLDIAVVAGKSFVVYFPLRAVGTLEDVLELKRFVKERIQEGVHGELDRAGLEERYREKCPYYFAYEKTREEAAEFEARMTPKPFISAGYWSGSVIFLMFVYLLTAGLVLRGFYLAEQFENALLILAGITVLLAWGSVHRHRYVVVRKKNLAKAEEKLARGAVGWQMMAFCEDYLVTANPWEVRELSWSFIVEIRGCEEGAAFMLDRRRFLALPEKVFGNEEEKQNFIDYCGQMKAQAEKRKH